MYVLSSFAANIQINDYIERFRDTERILGYCARCDRYGVCWTCPPIPPDIGIDFSDYEAVCIIGTKVTLNAAPQEKDPGQAGKEVFIAARAFLDPAMLMLEKAFSGSRALFAGSCQFCDACTRQNGLACPHAEKIRPSLEALGFDVGKTSNELLGIELQWCAEKLPDYFLLVGALLCAGKTPSAAVLKRFEEILHREIQHCGRQKDFHSAVSC